MAGVLRVTDPPAAGLPALLARYGLSVQMVPDGAAIPGSYWGEPEAGVIGTTVYLRPDTPLHSALHEACHLICMDAQRRAQLHTDAGGSELEECGVCVLQVLLAEELFVGGSRRMLTDMDAWGYSFRLGSARRWYEQDADDARAFLAAHGLIDRDGRPVARLRGA